MWRWVRNGIGVVFIMVFSRIFVFFGFSSVVRFRLWGIGMGLLFVMMVDVWICLNRIGLMFVRVMVLGICFRNFVVMMVCFLCERYFCSFEKLFGFVVVCMGKNSVFVLEGNVVMGTSGTPSMLMKSIR